MCVGKRHLLTTARAAGRSAAPCAWGRHGMSNPPKDSDRLALTTPTSLPHTRGGLKPYSPPAPSLPCSRPYPARTAGWTGHANAGFGKALLDHHDLSPCSPVQSRNDDFHFNGNTHAPPPNVSYCHPVFPAFTARNRNHGCCIAATLIFTRASSSQCPLTSCSSMPPSARITTKSGV